jgi:hypothetical protein
VWLDLRPLRIVQPVKMLHLGVLLDTLNHIPNWLGILIEYEP